MDQRWQIPLVALWSVRAVMLSFVVTWTLFILNVPTNGPEKVQGSAVLWLTLYGTAMLVQSVWWASRRFFTRHTHPR